jgi:hypothetical protein
MIQHTIVPPHPAAQHRVIAHPPRGRPSTINRPPPVEHRPLVNDSLPPPAFNPDGAGAASLKALADFANLMDRETFDAPLKTTYDGFFERIEAESLERYVHLHVARNEKTQDWDMEEILFL